MKEKVEIQNAIATKMINEDGTINEEAKIDMEIKTRGGYTVVDETLKCLHRKVM